MKKGIVSFLIVVVVFTFSSKVCAAEQIFSNDSLFDAHLCLLDSSHSEQTDRVNKLDECILNVIPNKNDFIDKTLFDYNVYNPVEEPAPIDSLKKISLTFLYIIPGLSIEIGYPNVFEGFSFEIDLFFYPALIYFTAFDVKYAFKLDPTFSFGFGLEIASVIVEEDGDGMIIAPFAFFKIPYGYNKMIEISVGLARFLYYNENDEYNEDEDDFRWTPAMEFSFGIHF